MVPPDDDAPDEDAGGDSSTSDEDRRRYEKQLVAACLAHEPEALDELLARYAKNLRAGAAVALRSKKARVNSAELDELWEELSAKLMIFPDKFLGHFDPLRGKLSSLLFIIARRFALRKLRPKSVRPRTRFVSVPWNVLDKFPDPSHESLVSAELLASLLDQLGAQSREIIERHWGLTPFTWCWTIPEIAEHFGWGPKKTYRRYERAMEQLRKLAHSFQGKAGDDVPNNLKKCVRKSRSTRPINR